MARGVNYVSVMTATTRLDNILVRQRKTTLRDLAFVAAVALSAALSIAGIALT
jgi:hypothetical protein